MPNPECVWLLRHAETATPQLFHGAESDIGLSDRGRLQAAALADWFTDLRPTVAASSAMSRAVATAAPVAAKLGLRHHVEPTLHERRVGEFSGREFGEVEARWRETLEHWTAGDTAFTTPGAESYDDLRTRLLAAWRAVTAAHLGERLVIVAHGIVCKVLLLELLGCGPAGWEALGKVPNVAVSTLTPMAAGYAVSELFVVPEPVLRVSGGVPTGLGQVRQP
jgi:probable phosphoglycerate mutase